MNQNNRRGSSGGFRSGGNNRFGGRSGGNNFNRGPREMHKAICADCKQDCEVPFKPTEGKPVYCKECYSKHKKY
jgi:CxxC-x17-CxxC domain-containing protein